MQRSGTVPEVFNDQHYAKEVLSLREDETEDAADEQLMNEAQALGIVVTHSPAAIHKAQLSACDSAFTITSGLARSGSLASRVSASTDGTTPRTSIEPDSNGGPHTITQKSESKRSLSFSDYDKFTAQFEANQSGSKVTKVPTATRKAPSLFSVSTRSTYISITSGIKEKFKLRRKGTVKYCREKAT